jgi:hypothetical protein
MQKKNGMKVSSARKEVEAMMKNALHNQADIENELSRKGYILTLVQGSSLGYVLLYLREGRINAAYSIISYNVRVIEDEERKSLRSHARGLGLDVAVFDDEMIHLSRIAQGEKLPLSRFHPHILNFDILKEIKNCIFCIIHDKEDKALHFLAGIHESFLALRDYAEIDFGYDESIFQKSFKISFSKKKRYAGYIKYLAYSMDCNDRISQINSLENNF